MDDTSPVVFDFLQIGYPGSLRDHISTAGRTSLPNALHILHDVLEGLAYAYEKDKVIHIDLKPENILCDFDEDRVTRHGENSFMARIFKVGDWGIASIKQPQLDAIAGMPPSHEECVKTLNNMGTILYMAPERFVRGYRSSIASDVFSLGMIFLELVTGKLPFQPDCSPVETLLSFSYHTEAVFQEFKNEPENPRHLSFLTDVALRLGAGEVGKTILETVIEQNEHMPLDLTGVYTDLGRIWHDLRTDRKRELWCYEMAVSAKSPPNCKFPATRQQKAKAHCFAFSLLRAWSYTWEFEMKKNRAGGDEIARAREEPPQVHKFMQSE
ncbi:MAG: protein kinase domain-containing protein [Limisphaerales bacterium]